MLKLSLTFCSDKIHQGGGVAAPIASQVLGEVLPYLEIKKDNQDEEEKGEVEVPNLIGLTRKEAKKTLEEEGLLIETKESLKTNLDDEDEKIKSQLPKAGIKIKQGSTVYVDK